MLSTRRFASFVVLSLTLLAYGPVVHAQVPVEVQRGFAPLAVPPVTIVPPPPNREVCQRPLPAMPSGSTAVVDTPEAVTELDYRILENPYFREALNHWAIREYVREHVFEERPSEEELLGFVRSEYSLSEILTRLCRGLPTGTSCRPRIVWRATFVRTPWCAVAESGGQPLPATDTVVLGTMRSRVCLAGPSSPLPCPAPSRVGRVRVMRGDLAQLVARPPSVPDENMTGDAVGDAFGYGGLGGAGTGWGGMGTGEGAIGMGNIGTMGHGSGAGSGQGYGSGDGRGLRYRGIGPTVRAAPPSPPAP